MINCFWVSGQYKGNGHAKALLQSAIEDTKTQGKNGLVTVVGTKKFHFMSDTKWLLKQGFNTIESLSNGFSLLGLKFDNNAPPPSFKECVKSGECEEKNGLVVYYTNRCPFTDYYVNGSLLRNKDAFVYGAALTLELETYLTDRMVLLLNVRERAMFGSSIGTFHTQVGIGMKCYI